MDTHEVSAGIEQLVDHLRTNQSTSVTLGDIAGVTEVLLATMRRYFASIDTTLYSEFRGLSEYIERARTEISELRPNDLKQERIPRAGLELEAIVAATENATGTIMDAAEEIMSADPASEEYGDAVSDACMRIFEACSFQDITGQRITKVVSTLTYIEERLHGLQDAWGPDIADADGEAPASGAEDDTRPDADLLNGPALDGEGIEQDRVDDLLAGVTGEEDAAEEPIEGGDVGLDAEPVALQEDDPDLGAAEPDANVSQADIDAMLNGENEAAHTDDADDGAEPDANVSQADIDAMLNGEDEAAHTNGADDDAEPDANVSQADIDAMLNGEDIAEEAPAKPKSEAKPKKTPKKASNEAAAEPGAAQDSEPELDDIVALTGDTGETVSQDDIDAMFD